MEYLHFDLTDAKQRLCALPEFTDKGWQPREVEDFFALEQMDRRYPALMENDAADRLWAFRRRYASAFPAAHD